MTTTEQTPYTTYDRIKYVRERIAERKKLADEYRAKSIGASVDDALKNLENC